MSLEGGAAARPAWRALLRWVVVRCLLHGWGNIRSRGQLSVAFAALSERAWDG